LILVLCAECLIAQSELRISRPERRSIEIPKLALRMFLLLILQICVLHLNTYSLLAELLACILRSGCDGIPSRARILGALLVEFALSSRARRRATSRLHRRSSLCRQRGRTVSLWVDALVRQLRRKSPVEARSVAEVGSGFALRGGGVLE
jgi:hypothetical protein